MRARQAERRDHPRDQRRLRQGLAAADRQRQITAREIDETMGHKHLARHFFERAQQIEIADPLRTQAQQKDGLLLRPRSGSILLRDNQRPAFLHVLRFSARRSAGSGMGIVTAESRKD